MQCSVHAADVRGLEEPLASRLKAEIPCFGGFSSSLKVNLENMGADKGWKQERKEQKRGAEE